MYIPNKHTRKNMEWLKADFHWAFFPMLEYILYVSNSMYKYYWPTKNSSNLLNKCDAASYFSSSINPDHDNDHNHYSWSLLFQYLNSIIYIIVAVCIYSYRWSKSKSYTKLFANPISIASIICSNDLFYVYNNINVFYLIHFKPQ